MAPVTDSHRGFFVSVARATVDTVELYPVDMAEITVRSEQRTVDWEEGAVFVVERTDYLDKLIAQGRLTVVDSGGTVVEPARSGKGSGAEVWRNFLDHHGVNHEKGDNRDDLIERWENHQVAQAEANTQSAAVAATAAQQDLEQSRDHATEEIADLNKELDES